MLRDLPKPETLFISLIYWTGESERREPMVIKVSKDQKVAMDAAKEAAKQYGALPMIVRREEFL